MRQAISLVTAILVDILVSTDEEFTNEFLDAVSEFAPEWSYQDWYKNPSFISDARAAIGECIKDVGRALDIEAEMHRSFKMGEWDHRAVFLMALGHARSRHFLDFIIEGGGYDEERDIIRNIYPVF